MHRRDEIDRIAIEGKFGQGKRRFTLGRIMSKLAQTSEATIAIAFIVMNLEKILSSLLYFVLCVCRMCRIPLRPHAAEDHNRHWDMHLLAQNSTAIGRCR